MSRTKPIARILCIRYTERLAHMLCRLIHYMNLLGALSKIASPSTLCVIQNPTQVSDAASAVVLIRIRG